MPASQSTHLGRRPDATRQALWQQRLNRFERSGLSVSEFCDREGVSSPSFYAWRRRLRSAPPTDADGPRFLPIQVLASASVELVLPSGAVLRLTAGCDLAFVRALVDSLGGASC